MFTIRNMQQDDLEQVVAIEQSIFSDPWSVKAFSDSLNQELCIYLVVEREKEIVGYCGLYVVSDEGQITNVAVKQEYRNAHIATEMLTALINKAKGRGACDFTLEVRQSNTAAIHVYEKLGFQSVGLRKKFYDKPIEDAVIMWLYN
ncbi:ribosomal protein S18-alanine N-acetyltransferase [Anaerosporobacter faecicola]|uniref:ribosomal protein S18-alanine N-acetyltransferase n=1 Tax=Anaerosporobacter faecicola TaxID=2718714 RepID=UPI001EE5C361|nr:ribosomal protein S18-alanine N-acetyltransferase [Anaerosporobacter faecicola]